MVAHVAMSLPDYCPGRFLGPFQIFHNTCDYDGIRQLGDVEALCEQVPPLALTGAIFDMMVHAADPGFDAAPGGASSQMGHGDRGAGRAETAAAARRAS